MVCGLGYRRYHVDAEKRPVEDTCMYSGLQKIPFKQMIKDDTMCLDSGQEKI
jgi:hypothetical protein